MSRRAVPAVRADPGVIASGGTARGAGLHRSASRRRWERHLGRREREAQARIQVDDRQVVTGDRRLDGRRTLSSMAEESRLPDARADALALRLGRDRGEVPVHARVGATLHDEEADELTVELRLEHRLAVRRELVRTHVAYLRWLRSGSRRSSSRNRPVVKAEDAMASMPATSSSVASARRMSWRDVPIRVEPIEPRAVDHLHEPEAGRLEGHRLRRRRGPAGTRRGARRARRTSRRSRPAPLSGPHPRRARSGRSAPPGTRRSPCPTARASTRGRRRVPRTELSHGFIPRRPSPRGPGTSADPSPRKCIRARYSPMMPRANSCAPREDRDDRGEERKARHAAPAVREVADQHEHQHAERRTA